MSTLSTKPNTAAMERLRRSVGTMAGIAQARIRHHAQRIREAREQRYQDKK